MTEPAMIIPTQPGLVLVVDDVEANRVLAHAFLECLGWTVESFADAQSALDFLENTLPEAMLVDVRMPGIQGDVLASMLRRRSHTRALRLVCYTAHAMPDEVGSLRACGFDDVLIKPVQLADMRRVLPHPAAMRATPAAPAKTAEPATPAAA